MLDPYIGAVLSVIYAFCGYGMLYYQNNIWLDMMYLFPLLMVAFRELFEKKRIIPYTVMLTLMMIVNYYISYMIVVFIMISWLFAAGVTARRKNTRTFHVDLL